MIRRGRSHRCGRTPAEFAAVVERGLKSVDSEPREMNDDDREGKVDLSEDMLIDEYAIGAA